MKILLVWHAYHACSADCYLCCELQFLYKVFHQQNEYPIWVTNNVFKKFQNKQHKTTPLANDNEELNDKVKNHLSLLPYKGSDAMHVICSMPQQDTRALFDVVKMMVFLQG